MKLRVIAGAAALTLLTVAPTQAQAPATGDLTLSLGYDGRLYVRILSVELEQTTGRRNFQSKLRVLAQGPLAVFKKLDVTASSRGLLDRGAPRPDTFNYHSKSGKKERVLTAEWNPQDVETAASPAFESMGDPPATRAQRLEGADPLTALLRMSLAAHPCSGSFRFYDGKQRYNLNMSHQGVGKLDEAQKAMGLEAPVRCLAKYERVAGFKLNKTKEEQDAVGLRDMTMGFARLGPDGPWVISSLSIDTGIGPVQLRLARMKVTGANQLARLNAPG